MVHTKEEYRKAYETTLDEYKSGTHLARFDSCAKCVLTTKHSTYLGMSCKLCPENIFDAKNSIGCVERRNRAGASKSLNETQQKGVIEYHQEAIRELDAMEGWGEEQLEKFKLILLDLDDLIGAKYGLKEK